MDIIGFMIIFLVNQSAIGVADNHSKAISRQRHILHTLTLIQYFNKNLHARIGGSGDDIYLYYTVGFLRWFV